MSPANRRLDTLEKLNHYLLLAAQQARRLVVDMFNEEDRELAESVESTRDGARNTLVAAGGVLFDGTQTNMKFRGPITRIIEHPFVLQHNDASMRKLARKAERSGVTRLDIHRDRMAWVASTNNGIGAGDTPEQAIRAVLEVSID